MINLVIIMILIAIWEIPRLLKKKTRKDLIVFLFLWLFGFIHSSLLLMGIDYVNPIRLVILAVKTTKKIIME